MHFFFHSYTLLYSVSKLNPSCTTFILFIYCVRFKKLQKQSGLFINTSTTIYNYDKSTNSKRKEIRAQCKIDNQNTKWQSCRKNKRRQTYIRFLNFHPKPTRSRDNETCTRAHDLACKCCVKVACTRVKAWRKRKAHVNVMMSNEIGIYTHCLVTKATDLNIKDFVFLMISCDTCGLRVLLLE